MAAVDTLVPAWRETARRFGVIWWVGQAPAALSGRKWQGAQSRHGAAELVFPRPALGKMQGEPSGQGEETPPQGLGGDKLLTETDAGGPAGQAVGDDPVSSTGQALDGQPGPLRHAQDWRGSGPRGDG